LNIKLALVIKAIRVPSLNTKDANNEIKQPNLPPSVGRKATLVLQDINIQNEGQKDESSQLCHKSEQKLY